jgi:hypothetical protein
MRYEEWVDAEVFEALRCRRPRLVDAVSDLLAMGQSPAQIERYLRRKYGNVEIVRQVRHVADHLARIG